MGVKCTGGELTVPDLAGLERMHAAQLALTRPILDALVAAGESPLSAGFTAWRAMQGVLQVVADCPFPVKELLTYGDVYGEVFIPTPPKREASR